MQLGMETTGWEVAGGKASRGTGRWTGIGAEEEGQTSGPLMGDEQDSAATEAVGP